MSTRTKLYEVEFVRTVSAIVYVMAADEADLKAQIADGMADLPRANDWFDMGDGATETYAEVHDSHGNQVWSGGPKGDWLPPVERAS